MVKLILLMVGLAKADLPIVGKPHFTSNETRLRVALVDTGVNLKALNDSRFLCSDGHKDFTGEGVFKLTNPHGAKMFNLITAGLDYRAVCVSVIKYYSESATATQNTERSMYALKYASLIKPVIVNYSGGGPEANPQEERAVRDLVEYGAIVIVAGGNQHMNLTALCDFFPACYASKLGHPHNFIVVGNITKDGRRSPTSNWGGPINAEEIGTDVSDGKTTTTGTSEATAIRTNRVLRGYRGH